MTTLHFISVLVAIAAIFGWVSVRWLRLPITIGTVLLTVVLSLLLEAISSWAPGLHHWALVLVHQINFEDLILHGMLSLLLFAGAFLVEMEFLVREKLIVTTLAVGGTVISTGLTAALMWLMLTVLGLHPRWLPCLFFGALISPTDPIAVLQMLRRVGAPKRLQAQLAGESLFNDGIGAVIFLTLLGVANGVKPTAVNIAWTLLLEIGGGIALGILGAWATSWLMRLVQTYQVDILLTLGLALGGYSLAEVLHLSAPLEAVVAAIALRQFNTRRGSETIALESIDRFWEVIDEIQNSLLFVLLGLEVLSISFRPALMELGLAAIAIVLAVRMGVVALLLGSLRTCTGQPRRSSIVALTWGGLRGGLGLALAFAVPVNEGSSWILPVTYIVVVFSIVVQGWSMALFLRRFSVAARHLAPAA
jgi:CPA1 family monovalent cation:H+ antiporter